jgi:hypothetical protein
VDFNLPKGLVDYLAELDRFIEAEIKPLEQMRTTISASSIIAANMRARIGTQAACRGTSGKTC